MNGIGAIETIYNGYRFRSRLEARWAVFFDQADMPYQYEPEGFDLGPYGYYLPDFYLPWFNAYVEIKPKDSREIPEARKKLMALFDGTEFLTMLCVGDPADDDIRIYCNDMADSSGGGPNEWPAQFIKGAVLLWDGTTGEYGKNMISIVVGPPNDRERQFFNSKWEKLSLVDQSRSLIWYRDDYKDAKLVARQARFEHGETPTVGR